MFLSLGNTWSARFTDTKSFKVKFKGLAGFLAKSSLLSLARSSCSTFLAVCTCSFISCKYLLAEVLKVFERLIASRMKSKGLFGFRPVSISNGVFP